LDSRSRILSTATRLFAQQGFAGVSLQNIAERVGITKPSLLYHFPSKDRLREEVLGEAFEHWATRLPGLLRAVTSGADQFEALMDELTTFFRDDPDRTHLIVRELLDRPEETRIRLADSLAPLVRLVADTMRKGQAVGILNREVDPEAFVLNMICLTVSMRVAAPVIEPIIASAEESPLARLERELRRMAFTSIFRDPTRAPLREVPDQSRSQKER
jgi:TetR/AcrR family transcriptional regulator